MLCHKSLHAPKRNQQAAPMTVRPAICYCHSSTEAVSETAFAASIQVWMSSTEGFS